MVVISWWKKLKRTITTLIKSHPKSVWALQLTRSLQPNPPHPLISGPSQPLQSSSQTENPPHSPGWRPYWTQLKRGGEEGSSLQNSTEVPESVPVCEIPESVPVCEIQRCLRKSEVFRLVINAENGLWAQANSLINYNKKDVSKRLILHYRHLQWL